MHTAARWLMPCLVFACLPGEEPSDRVLVHRLLVSRCFACHGADRADGGIRLDRGIDLPLIVTPGNPERSRLIELVRMPVKDPLAMPPASADERLSADDVALLTRWIVAGAEPPQP